MAGIHRRSIIVDCCSSPSSDSSSRFRARRWSRNWPTCSFSTGRRGASRCLLAVSRDGGQQADDHLSLLLVPLQAFGEARSGTNRRIVDSDSSDGSRAVRHHQLFLLRLERPTPLASSSSSRRTSFLRARSFSSRFHDRAREDVRHRVHLAGGTLVSLQLSSTARASWADQPASTSPQTNLTVPLHAPILLSS